MKTYALISILLYIIEFSLFADKLEEWRVLREYAKINCWLLGAIVFNILAILMGCEIYRWHRQED